LEVFMAQEALDALDVRLLGIVQAAPRAGYLEWSRRARVSRATVQARLERMERAGIVTGYGPEVDLSHAGYPVQALATLEISQGALAEVAAGLADVPEVVEAVATTGAGDVQCRLAAVSHEGLQETLLRISRIPGVARSTSVVVLSCVVPARYLPLLEASDRRLPRRVRP
jgi:DNA-binding Lrp family transcriptional regulator